MEDDSETEDIRESHDCPYEIREELGRGGMGVVYRARQKSPQREVALKMLLPGVGLAKTRERFLVEAQALAELQHPGILPLFDFGELDGQPYFTTRLASGGSLSQRLQEGRGPSSPEESASLLATLAASISYAHKRGVLHRDIKPSNVLFDEQNHALVADFGLARVASMDAMLTQTGVLGTPHYMAPEVVQHGANSATTSSDIYGLGAVFHELLSGKPPFHSANLTEMLRAIVEQETPPPRSPQGIAEVPKDLQIICLKCLAKEPAKRYSTAAELEEDLRRWLRGEPILARPFSTAERLVSWARRNPKLALLSGALAASLVAGLVGQGWALRETRKQESLAREGKAKADKARSDAEALIESLLGDFADRMEALGRQEILNETFSKLGAYYERSPDQARPPDELRRHARLMLRWANVLWSQNGGDPVSQSLAEEKITEAQALCEAALLAEPGNSASKTLLARSLLQLGALREKQNDFKAAVATWDRVPNLLSFATQAPEEHPEAAAILAGVYTSKLNLVSEEMWSTKQKEPRAVQWLTMAEELARKALTAPGLSIPQRRELAMARAGVARAESHLYITLASQVEQTSEARRSASDRAMKAALAYEQSLRDIPTWDGVDQVRDFEVAKAQSWRADLMVEYGLAPFEEALGLMNASLDEQRRLTRQEPRNGLWRAQLSGDLVHLAGMCRRSGDNAAELKALFEAIQVAQDLAERQTRAFPWMQECQHVAITIHDRWLSYHDCQETAPWEWIRSSFEPLLSLEWAILRNPVLAEFPTSCGDITLHVQLAGRLLRAHGEEQLATELYPQWKRRFEEQAAKESSNPLWLSAQAYLWRRMAEDHVLRQEHDQALAALQRELALRLGILEKNAFPKKAKVVIDAVATAYRAIIDQLIARNLLVELGETTNSALANLPKAVALSATAEPGWRRRWCEAIERALLHLQEHGDKNRARHIAEEARLALVSGQGTPNDAEKAAMERLGQLAAGILAKHTTP